jgi:hypothetical protein
MLDSEQRGREVRHTRVESQRLCGAAQCCSRCLKLLKQYLQGGPAGTRQGNSRTNNVRQSPTQQVTCAAVRYMTPLLACLLACCPAGLRVPLLLHDTWADRGQVPRSPLRRAGVPALLCCLHILLDRDHIDRDHIDRDHIDNTSMTDLRHVMC